MNILDAQWALKASIPTTASSAACSGYNANSVCFATAQHPQNQPRHCRTPKLAPTPQPAHQPQPLLSRVASDRAGLGILRAGTATNPSPAVRMALWGRHCLGCKGRAAGLKPRVERRAVQGGTAVQLSPVQLHAKVVELAHLSPTLQVTVPVKW